MKCSVKKTCSLSSLGSVVLPIFSILLFGCLCPSPARADVIFDATDSYSSTSNPNGVWSAGVKATRESFALELLSVNDGLIDVNAWHLPTILDDAPGFGKNIGTLEIQGIAPGQLFVHPGNTPGVNELVTLRFTVPWTGVYLLNSHFFDGNVGETVGYVYLNGVEQFASLSSVNPLYSTSMDLVAGDQVDFIVDSFTDSYFADATGLSVQFSTSVVPEPSSLLLFTVAAIASFARRRRPVSTRIQSCSR